MSEHVSTTDHAHGEHKTHVNPWIVFAVLALMTVIEVIVALPALGISPATLSPLLVAMALVKASLVALYYMHLRYEKPVFLIIFITPTLFAVLLTVVLMANI
jgi:cytochrome c oxidase subunit 4